MLGTVVRVRVFRMLGLYAHLGSDSGLFVDYNDRDGMDRLEAEECESSSSSSECQ